MRRASIKLLTSVLAVALLAAACGGGGQGGEGEPGASYVKGAKESTIIAVVVSDDHSVGLNRFAIVLLDAENLPIDDATVHVRFYRVLTETTAEPAFEADTERHVLENWFPHPHQDSSTHFHREATTYYTVPSANFDRAGNWGAEFLVSRPGAAEVTVRGTAFQVLETSSTPALGRPVPATDNLTIHDVSDITEIDSSDPPRPELHAMSIADALADGKPFVVTFSSPAFCQSRLCGPVTDVVASLQSVYGDKVNFIHIEPYDLDLLRNQGQFQLIPASQEWGLPSEPWTFVVDASGRLVAKFAGVLSPEELEAALAPLVTS